MPVRSSTSSVHGWPDRETVHDAVGRWAEQLAARRGDVVSVGYLGSYARGDWGPGSDVDLVVVVERTEEPFWRRGRAFDTTGLPVPADLLVYEREEWAEKMASGDRFARTARREAVWVLGRPATGSGSP